MRFDDLTPGQSAERTVHITAELVERFADLSGGNNPVHLDESFAAQTMFGRRIAHGMLLASFVSSVLAGQLPGPGTVYLSQTLSFKKPVFLGDFITTRATISLIKPDKRIVVLQTECVDQDGTTVLGGEAVIKFVGE